MGNGGLAFRFLEPETYREIAGLLDEKRGEREVNMAQLRERVSRSCVPRASAPR